MKAKLTLMSLAVVIASSCLAQSGEILYDLHKQSYTLAEIPTYSIDVKNPFDKKAIKPLTVTINAFGGINNVSKANVGGFDTKYTFQIVRFKKLSDQTVGKVNCNVGFAYISEALEKPKFRFVTGISIVF